MQGTANQRPKLQRQHPIRPEQTRRLPLLLKRQKKQLRMRTTREAGMVLMVVVLKVVGRKSMLWGRVMRYAKKTTEGPLLF